MSENSVVSVVVMRQEYVGLPLAMRAAQVGYCATGFEPDPARLARLIEGDSYIEDVEDSVLRAHLAAGDRIPGPARADHRPRRVRPDVPCLGRSATPVLDTRRRGCTGPSRLEHL